MKQLLLATATLVGMSAAAFAAEPVALTDSQLDNVTAGQTFATLQLPVVTGQAGIGAAAPFPAVLQSEFVTNLSIATFSVP